MFEISNWKRSLLLYSFITHFRVVPYTKVYANTKQENLGFIRWNAREVWRIYDVLEFNEKADTRYKNSGL
jgi:hypothetical protein